MVPSHSKNELILAVSTVALANALTTTLVALARHHGGKPGPWLDEIERDVFREIKSTHTDGFSFEDENDLVRGVITLVETTFVSARNAMTTNKD